MHPLADEIRKMLAGEQTVPTAAFWKVAWRAADELDRLQAERDALKSTVAACHEAIGESAESDDDGLAEGIALWLSDLREELAFLQADRDRLAGALDEYGEHLRDCALSFFEAYDPNRGHCYSGVWTPKPPACTCGLDAARGGGG